MPLHGFATFNNPTDHPTPTPLCDGEAKRGETRCDTPWERVPHCFDRAAHRDSQCHASAIRVVEWKEQNHVEHPS